MPGFPDFPLSLRGWGNYSLEVSHSNLLYCSSEIWRCFQCCFREKAECSRSGIVGHVILLSVFFFFFLFGFIWYIYCLYHPR